MAMQMIQEAHMQRRITELVATWDLQVPQALHTMFHLAGPVAREVLKIRGLSRDWQLCGLAQLCQLSPHTHNLFLQDGIVSLHSMTASIVHD